MCVLLMRPTRGVLGNTSLIHPLPKCVGLNPIVTRTMDSTWWAHSQLTSATRVAMYDAGKPERRIVREFDALWRMPAIAVYVHVAF